MTLEHRRLNIGVSARKIRSGEQSINVGAELPKEEGFDALHKKVKPELYPLTSLITDRVIRRAHSLRSLRSPYGIVRTGENWWPEESRPLMPGEFDPKLPYTLSAPMRRTLLQALFLETEEISKGQSGELLKNVYTRLEQLVKGLRESEPDNPQVKTRYSDGAREFIATGVNFGSLVMSGVIDLIPRMYGPGDPPAYAEVARNSYPLIVKLSAGDLDKVSKVVECLSERDKDDPNHFLARFNPIFFRFKINAQGLYIDINEFGKDVFKKLGIDIDHLESEDGQTAGCVAGVNFGDGSAIKLLWNWHTEILEESQKLVQSKLGSSKRVEKIGRNDLCPCGSGLKYKKCHLGK